MLISGFEFIPMSVPVKDPLRVAKGGSYSRFEPVIVKVFIDSGIEGVGEVQCFPAYDREGPDPQAGALVLLGDLAAPLVGVDPFDIEEVWKRMDQRVYGHLWVKSGIDIAIYDAMGKAINKPTCSLIGGRLRTEHIAEGIGFTTSLDKTPEQVAEVAKRAVDAGFLELELKAGDPVPEKDLERLKAIRAEVGSGPSIKVDFNSGGDIKNSIALILRMEQVGIQAVEQPADAWNIDGLAEIRSRIETPIIVDESVNYPNDLLRIIEKRAADEVHIKPTVKGGLTGAVRLRAIAEAAGLKVVPGTLCPTGIGMGAVHAFLASCREVTRGVHPSPLEILADDIVENPLPVTPIIKILDGPGLGIILDEAKVEKYNVNNGKHHYVGKIS